MTIHQQINERIAAFAAELEALVRAAAIESVTAALGQGRATASRTPAASALRTRPTAAVSAAPSPRRGRKKGAKRDPKEIDALTDRLAAFIKANAGKRVEEIGKALRTPTSELALPITRLLANKTVKKTGAKRATKYFPR